MSLRYEKLLSPIIIGKHILKNRFVYPNASPHTLQGPETFPAEGFRDFYVNLARNGAAVVTIAEWNNPNQRNGPMSADFTHMQSFDMSDPSTHNYFSLMAEEIHFYGSKLFLSASVDWPRNYDLYGGPTINPAYPFGTVLQPVAKEEIPNVIQAFVEKIRFYKNLGYDGMTMRCDMDILPKSGTREDEYNSDTIENRSRFIRELYAAVKKEFGDQFITECVIAWEQPWGYGGNMGVGILSDDVARFCHLIDKDVDIFQVREHDGTRAHPTGFNFKQGEHPALDFCVRLKKEGITALLEPIGGFQEPDEMEAYLQEGKCDLFGAARAFMADYEYGIKLMEGRGEDIIPCLKCNKCHGEIHDEPLPWVPVCSVNPIHGLHADIEKLVVPTTAKKVAVIGGGASGMRAAIEAARKGHKVDLYEKTDTLGGQLLHADYFDFKWPIKNYKQWLVRQLHQLGVQVHMNCEPTREMLAEQGYDAVLAATGAIPVMPRNISGITDETGKSKYMHCWDVWGKEKELGDHVIIIGGSETGIETAIYLLRAGHAVTVLTRQNKIAHDASRLHYITMAFVKIEKDGRAHEAAEWERYERFTGIVNANTKSVSGNTVVYVDAEGNTQTITGDSVIICGGSKACTEEAMQYQGIAAEFYPIGDCIGARNIQACNRQAFARASII